MNKTLKFENVMPPGRPGSKSNEIVRRLLEGEHLHAQQVADEYKSSNSLLQVVVAKMQQYGYVMHREDFKLEGETMPRAMWSVLKHDPEEAKKQKKLGRAKTKAERVKVPAKKKPNLVPIEDTLPRMVEVPQFGANARIVLLSENEDGVVNVGFRQGDTMFLCEVKGVMTSANQ